jgi:hypothetical protein
MYLQMIHVGILNLKGFYKYMTQPDFREIFQMILYCFSKIPSQHI